ncbi:SnoaL-like protein [Thermosporothrix hazakensis]|uniref:SnoaL-like protein n=2 Tax=Thermosporothrix TaxID=768650 RepID=A0A326UG41_THEHA|nr:nuclear transport factor 2 family protein [Thermosporothrix hazakensis]PZW26330.1 SnoaL-like protein [Thermosporothrix hazakensis]BBH90668.1 hypothetical protein KTC_54190 [Thermosporothrix sp. COM3]GCE48719.1 hypothetical protein KTH_35880 [Thermosporothrix hazakensis]
MKEEHIQSAAVAAWVRAFNAHEVERLVSLYREDATLADSGMPAPRRGHEEIRQWFLWRFRSTPTITYQPVDVFEEGSSQVRVRWLAEGNGPRFCGARPFRVEGESCFQLQEGFIARQEGVYNHVSVLHQIIPPLRIVPTAVAGALYLLYIRLHRIS